ncbi:MAG: radical SAM/Cys-rich domain protein [Spirochaetia bacterium]|nr:radical SAM/Cys-rich domain protein [Spirochaetia bacterium]
MISVQEQKKVLAGYHTHFSGKVRDSLPALSFNVFQINVGRWCNQACHHCHVDASPKRTESMTHEIAEKCIEIIANVPSIKTVDITGGAPEGSLEFRYLVTESKKLGKHVIDRCNLTILEEPGFEYLYEFLASNKIEIIASLPHFAKSRTDSQRGNGVFDKSITALKKLNTLGYGTEIPISLVYNPSGLFLSSSQATLEREFKENLKNKFGITFNNLYCINNLPINRFLNSLINNNKFEEYMEILCTSYNPATLEGLMCRHQISVGYDGKIYDCDFNQMLDLTSENIDHVYKFNLEDFMKRNIVLANHCFGCTAGAGSSCGGELV